MCAFKRCNVAITDLYEHILLDRLQDEMKGQGEDVKRGDTRSACTRTIYASIPEILPVQIPILHMHAHQSLDRSVGH